MKPAAGLRRFYYFLPLLALVGRPAPAQTPAAASVAGTVRGPAGQPVAFATAVLVQLPDSALADSRTTDERGAYAFSAVRPGRYCVRALLLGYGPARSAAFEVGAGAVAVPPLRLAARATALAEVAVRGRPPVLEQLADRTVLHVDRLATAGDNALEVLKKAPGVQLDKDDNILYRGSAGVTVMLNDKLTYLTGEALTSYLRSLPASAIAQIELIPNPSASLDAAGTAGVLNIRLRRSQLPGLSGTANAGGGRGRYGRGWAGANLSYNLGSKLRVFARLDAGYYNSFNRLVISRRIRDSLFQQVNYLHPITRDLSYAAGAELALDKRQTLGLELRGANSSVPTQQTSESLTTDALSRPAGRLTLDSPQTNRADNVGLNLNYRLDLDSLGRELRADADYVHYGNAKNQQFTNFYYPPLGAAAQDAGRLRSDQSSGVRIWAAKVDYAHPFAGTQWKAETGLKTSRVTTRSASEFDQLAGADWRRDSLRTNQFRYQETISAAYLSLGNTWGRLELKGGLRGEQTHALGESLTTGQRVPRNYFQLFPSLFLNYKLTERDQLSLSGSRRITRPAYQRLNPFLTYTDAYTAHQGNPFLAPSLAASAVLSYTHGNYQVFSLSYLRETDVINEVVYQNDQTKVTTSIEQNLDRSLTLSLTSGGHTDLAAWWGTDNQLIGTYGAVQTQVEGQPVQLRRFSWEVSTEHTFSLPRQFKLLVSGNYNSSFVNGLFYLKASGSVNLGLKKPLWHERATLSVKASDLFATSQWRSTLRYNNIDMVWNNQYDSRRLTATLTWKIGSGKARERHASGSADEEGRAGQ